MIRKILVTMFVLISFGIFAQETGTNDFRISNVNTDGVADNDGTDPACL